MKRYSAMCVVAGLFASATVLAAEGSLNEFKRNALPVLVQVDEQGNVTAVRPSQKLPVAVQDLLETTLHGWINQPARTKKGSPIDSTFIVNVALLAEPREDGNYDARFEYVSSLPVPRRGQVYWESIDGVRLALVEDRGGRIPQYPSMIGGSVPQPSSIAHAGSGGSRIQASQPAQPASHGGANGNR
jgi:hypothetical protein